jgi:hypothetical protein
MTSRAAIPAARTERYSVATAATDIERLVHLATLVLNVLFGFERGELSGVA